MIVWNVDWITVLTFVVATVLPLLVAIVSTKETDSRRKGIILAVLSLVTSVLSGILDALVNGTEYDLGGQLVILLDVFAWAVVSYFGIWRAEGKDGQSVTDKLTANVGRTVKLDPGSYQVRDQRE